MALPGHGSGVAACGLCGRGSAVAGYITGSGNATRQPTQATALLPMTPSLPDFLAGYMHENRHSTESLSRELGVSQPAVAAILEHRRPKPHVPVIGALVTAFGFERGRQWFPWVARLELLVAIVQAGYSEEAFSRKLGVTRSTLHGIVFEGAGVRPGLAEAIGHLLRTPPADLGIEPRPPDGAGTGSARSFTGQRLGRSRGLADQRDARGYVYPVVRQLCKLHILIRRGWITPSWECHPDYAPLEQMEREFREARIHRVSSPDVSSTDASGSPRAPRVGEAEPAARNSAAG